MKSAVCWLSVIALTAATLCYAGVGLAEAIHILAIAAFIGGSATMLTLRFIVFLGREGWLRAVFRTGRTFTAILLLGLLGGHAAASWLVKPEKQAFIALARQNPSHLSAEKKKDFYQKLNAVVSRRKSKEDRYRFTFIGSWMWFDPEARRYGPQTTGVFIWTPWKSRR